MRYTEHQVTSEILDQPLFEGVPRKIFICSTPRSGSYLMCRYMINAGLGVPHEYFNPIVMRQIAPRLGLADNIAKLKWRRRSPRDRLPFARAARTAEMRFLEQYIAKLLPRRCQSGIFAAKIHFDQYLKVLDNRVGRELLDGGLFIYLYREDLVAQAVSTHFAKLTGRWSVDDSVTTVPVERPDFYDVAAIDRTLEDLIWQDQGWRLFLARNGLSPITISYERLIEDPRGAVAAIACRLQIDPKSLRADYGEGGDAIGSASKTPSKDQVIQHYLAAVREIHAVTEPQADKHLASTGIAQD